ncbi:hypothetical protein AAG906_022495 [Vitis piasezkii]
MRGAALAGSCRRCCNISMYGEVHPLRGANGTLPASAWPSRARGRFYSSSWGCWFCSVGQGCIDHGQLKAQTHGPLYNPRCETMTNDCASNVLAYPEKIQAGNKHISRNNVNSTAPHHSRKVVQSNGSLSMKPLEDREEANFIFSRDRAADAIENDESNERSIIPATGTHAFSQLEARRKLSKIYEKVLIVDDIYVAKKLSGSSPLSTSILSMHVTQRHELYLITLIKCFLIISQVANIDVKRKHLLIMEIICFSIYSGPEADFGNGKSCIWVDVLDGGGRDLLVEFAPFFEDPSIQKVWHNYSFDNHVIENYDLKVSGFHADTMHMARLWDSSRRAVGGYSLEALTRDSKVMSGADMSNGEELIGKKDGTEGKIITIAPVEHENKLLDKEWLLDGARKGCMFDFYQKYWRPFGMLVDRAYLSKVEKVAKAEEQVAANRFRNWASKHCPDAKYMNVGSDTQLRQLLFGGVANRKDPNECLPMEKTFKIPNVDKVIEEGKKAPTKFRNITLSSFDVEIPIEMCTASGWPSVSGDALKTLAGKVSADFDFIDDAECDFETTAIEKIDEDTDISAYGTAYAAFGEGGGRKACHAIAALCEVCSINSLISNFILPLQDGQISGKNGRFIVKLNINTETGRLSARRPNLQNQPALEKDRSVYFHLLIEQCSMLQLELRILAHLANCKSMLNAFKAGGDFHSRTAMNMYPHIREAVEKEKCFLIYGKCWLKIG